MNRCNPYKLFDYYTEADADVFFGREAEISAVVGDILANKLLVLFARSGSGKTSLLNAGIGPALREIGRIDEGDPGIRMVTIRLSGELTPEQSALAAIRAMPGFDIPSEVQTLHEAVSRTCRIQETDGSSTAGLVLVFDQFEELFISLFKDEPEIRREFAEQLEQIIYNNELRVYVVLSLRSDYFHHLNEFRDVIPDIFQNNTNLELRPFSDDAALRVIRGPAEQPDSGFTWENGLPEGIVADLKAANEDQDGVLPIQLQIVCYDLWESLAPGEKLITRQHYEHIGLRSSRNGNWSPTEAMVHNRIIAPLEALKGRSHRYLLKVLRELITRHQTKATRSLTELAEVIPEKHLLPVLEHLERALLLRREKAEETDWYELRHDYLALEMSPWLEAQQHALKKRDNLLLGISILVLVTLSAVAARLWSDWNDYQAKIGSPNHSNELTITRNPAFGFYMPAWWRFEVTTGFLRPQLQAGELPEYDFDVPDALRNWSEIEPHLHEQERWGLQLATRVTNRADGPSVDKTLFESIGHDDIGLYAAVDPRILEFVKQVQLEANSPGKIAAIRGLGAAAESLEPASAQAVVTDLRQALRDGNADVRGAAARALGEATKFLERVGTQAVVNDLRQALKDGEADVRGAAAAALGAAARCLEPASAGAVGTDLLQALKDGDADVREAAAAALGEAAESLDPAGAGAVVTDLRRALKDGDADVRRAAADAFGAAAESLDLAARAVVTDLRQALKDGDAEVRQAAAGALGTAAESLDPADARAVVTDLRQALMDGDAFVRQIAARALGATARSLDPASALAVVTDIVQALKDGNVHVRRASADAFAETAAHAQQPEIAGTAFLILVAYFDRAASFNFNWFCNSCRTLASAHWQQTDKQLLAWLSHDEAKYREFATYVLAQRQPLDSNLMSQIRRLRYDPEGRPWVKMAALQTLVEIERERLVRKRVAENRKKDQVRGELCNKSPND